MKLQDIKDLGVDSSVLDGSIMVNVIMMAEEASRKGIDAQAEMLMSLGLSEEEVVGIFLREVIKEGDTVKVKEPKSEKEYHSSFSGVVHQIAGQNGLVVMANNELFDVCYTEIESIAA